MASIQLTSAQVRLLRLRSQRLHPDTALTQTSQLVKEVGALQSQEWLAAMLAIRARTHGLSAAHVRHAREVERSVVLTWAMRGTLHLVAAEDVQGLLALFGSRFISQTAQRYKQLNLDEPIRHKAIALLPDLLHERGPLTRPELAGALGAYGIPVQGQAIHHLLRFAALRGVVCFGPEREGVLTYTALDDWLADLPQRHFNDDQMLAEIVRRYVEAYGPARLEDFVRWSGLPSKTAQIGFETIRHQLIEVDLMGHQAFISGKLAEWLNVTQDAPQVRLLPRYDSYWLGYASRDVMVPDVYAKRVHPGGGLIHAVLIVNGQAAARWRIKRHKECISIDIQPFEKISDEIVAQVRTEACAIAQFLGEPIHRVPVTIGLPMS